MATTVTTTTTPTGPPVLFGFTGPLPPEVTDFLQAVNTIPIEQEISQEEASQALVLFSVMNILLAGKSQRQVGNETKVDVLGVLTLYYGLQDRSLSSRLVLNTQQLWASQEATLANLRDQLDKLGSDVVFLEKEGKRQFNLGSNNDVAGNVDFPRLFKRYVDIANDALLTLNIKAEDVNPQADKEKVGKAIDLLVELKGTILQIVRSLSKYGTIATSRVNKNWAAFEKDALGVLQEVARQRLTDDVDEKHPYAVLADVVGKNRDTQIAPYAVLAREGGQLLQLAMETYQRVVGQTAGLENYDRTHLMDLFQSGTPDQFLTAKMRARAAVIKRYPLANWG